MNNYWVTVTAQEHVNIVRNKGYTQVNMGPKDPLSTMQRGDWIIYYSPTIFHQKPTSICQKFTGISYVIDDEVYAKRYKESILWRRNIHYVHCKPVHVAELHTRVPFLQQYEDWIDAFYTPFFQITRTDFLIIAERIAIVQESSCFVF